MKTVLQELFFSFGFSLIISFSFAQAGTPDSSFGVNGNVVLTDGLTGQSVALQTDGKLIIAGYKMVYIEYVYRIFLVYRLLPNGVPDSSFGINGKTEFKLEGVHDCFVGDVKIQEDQKIIVGGTAFRLDDVDFCLFRLNQNGSIDSTFGTNGQVITNVRVGAEDVLNNLNIQDDGKILASGASYGQSGFSRYNIDGSLDTTFGTNGIIYSALNWEAFSSRTLSDRKFIAVSVDSKNRDPYYGYTDFSAVKYLSSGKIDSSFGKNGVTDVDFAENRDVPKSMAVLGNGDILIGGNAFYENAFFPAMTKLKSNGVIDSSFGSFGRAKLNFGVGEVISSIVVQTDEKIVIVVSDIRGGSLLISRLLKDGNIDSSFGVAGAININLTSLNGLLNYNLNCIALQSDSKIVITGGPQIIVQRFKNDIPVTVSIKKNISLTEGNSGITPAKFNIVLNKAAATNVTVNYTTKDLSAKAGSDFTAKSGTVTFPAGVVNRAVTINVTTDNTLEKNERFALVLSNPVNAVFGTIDSAICIIKNDDPSFAKDGVGNDAVKASGTIRLYPNPVKDAIQIEGLSNEKKAISITDVSGKLITINTTSSITYSQNVKQLPSGIYYIRIESNNTKVTLKFIK